MRVCVGLCGLFVQWRRECNGLTFPEQWSREASKRAPSLDLQGLRQAISPEPQFSALANGKNTSGTDFGGWDRP